LLLIGVELEATGSPIGVHNADDKLKTSSICARVGQGAGPADIWPVKLKLSQRRQLVRCGDQIKFTQLAQFTQNVERLIRLLQHLRFRTEGNLVALSAVRSFRSVKLIGANRRKIEPLEIGRCGRIIVLGTGAPAIFVVDKLLKRRAAFAAKSRCYRFSVPG
jgi:hypothetical protein